jgi:translation initiation factor 3 subunit I
MLHGHERAITQIKYSREGDLLFSCAKDSQPNVWFSINGERLGTYKGHTGAVWCLDVDWETTKLLTGSADNTCRLWDVETGKQLLDFSTKSAIRTCGFSFSGNLIMYTTDKAMGQPCEMLVYDLRDSDQIRNNEPLWTVQMPKSKVTSAIWGPLDELIITGHDNGDLNQWDVKAQTDVMTTSEHTKQINDIQLSKDMNFLITASKDATAKLFDTYSMKLMKTFKTDRPVNSAAISPLKPHVVMGGGQEAMDVTTTSTRIGKFDARFYHMVFEEEFGRIKGHFGPINSVAFHPDGKGYSSGGEDGYIRVHQFDSQYFNFEFEF